MVHLAKLALAGGLIYWLVVSGELDFRPLAGSFFGGGHLLVALLVLLNFAAQVQRWRLLLRAQKVAVSPGTAARLFCIGQFFSIVSLGGVASEAARAYYIARHAPDARLAGLSTILLDVLLGLFSYLLLGAAASVVWLARDAPMLPAVAAIGLFSGLLALGIALAAALLLWPPGRAWLLGWLPAGWRPPLSETIRTYREAPRQVVLAMVVSGVCAVTFIAAFFAAGTTLGTPMSWTRSFLVIPMVVLANSLPISLGGLGVGETAGEVLLGQLDVTGGAAIVLFVRLTAWAMALPLGGLFYVLERGRRV